MSGFYDGPEISFDSGKSGSSSGPVKFIVGYVIFEVIKSGVREVISERRVRKAKKESFQDGLKEGKNLTVKEIKSLPISGLLQRHCSLMLLTVTVKCLMRNAWK